MLSTIMGRRGVASDGRMPHFKLLIVLKCVRC
jgi:hypothetical protein